MTHLHVTSRRKARMVYDFAAKVRNALYEEAVRVRRMHTLGHNGMVQNNSHIQFAFGDMQGSQRLFPRNYLLRHRFYSLVEIATNIYFRYVLSAKHGARKLRFSQDTGRKINRL